MIADSQMVRAKIKAIILPVLLVPYVISMIGMFTSYFAFFYRTNFQSEITSFKDDKLERLVLSSTEFEKMQWTDGKKEFERGGKMFDVARIEQQGDSYFIYCENDSFEDLLISYLKTAGSKTKSIQLFHAQFFEPITEFDCNNSSLSFVKPDHITVNLYVSVTHELNTPPPKVC